MVSPNRIPWAWSQQRLVRELGGGFYQSMISGWETGKHTPDAEQVQRLEQVFGKRAPGATGCSRGCGG